ncbi:MAG: NAD-binding protein [bacterium]|nr:NAD-binding protein [bacterium]
MAALAIVTAGGTIGFAVLKNISLSNALYLTICLISTVGNREIGEHPVEIFFAILVIFTGMGTLLYGVSNITAFILEGQLNNILRRKKMNKNISKLEGHFIICGSGKTGLAVIEEFYKTKNPFVVVEKQEEILNQIPYKDELLFVIGDATQDETLELAGIKKAKGLISTLNDDTSNLFIVFTARSLKPDLRIISKAEGKDSERKILKAGANATVSPNRIGGMRLASVALRPVVVSFLDTMLKQADMSLRMECVTIADNSSLIRKTLGEADIAQKTGLIVVAVEQAETKNYIYNPRMELVLNVGDSLIVMGNAEQLEKLRKLVE